MAITLGLLACRQGKRVRFYCHRSDAQVQKLDLLILDEVGFVPFNRHEWATLVHATVVPGKWRTWVGFWSEVRRDGGQR